MSSLLINITVGAVLFVGGISLTIKRYGTHDRLAFTVVAILSPIVAVFAVFRLLYLASRRQLKVDPCPPGLEDAERIVERERQRRFGGPLREPSLAKSWTTAYERELQKETDRVREVAQKYLVLA